MNLFEKDKRDSLNLNELSLDFINACIKDKILNLSNEDVLFLENSIKNNNNISNDYPEDYYEDHSTYYFQIPKIKLIRKNLKIWFDYIVKPAYVNNSKVLEINEWFEYLLFTVNNKNIDVIDLDLSKYENIMNTNENPININELISNNDNQNKFILEEWLDILGINKFKIKRMC